MSEPPLGGRRERARASQERARGRDVVSSLDRNAKGLIFAFGVVFVMAMIALAVLFPTPTTFQYTVFRIVLALAAAGVAALIPGFIDFQLEARATNYIRAGGALAVFAIVYFKSPAALVLNPQEPLPEDPTSSQIQQSPPAKALSIGSVDAIEGDRYVVRFYPPKKIRVARVYNSGPEKVQVALVSFPEDVFYTNLTHESSTIEPLGDKAFRLVFMYEVPDRNRYDFELRDNRGFRYWISIELVGDWHAYMQQRLEEVKHELARARSADPNLNDMPEETYKRVRPLVTEDYPDVPQGLGEALTGQLLVSASEIDASAVAFALAERSEPGLTERLVVSTGNPVLFTALAQRNLDSRRGSGGDGQAYERAARWFHVAAVSGYREAQYRLGELYVRGVGVTKDMDLARRWFEQAAAGGHDGAREVLRQLDPKPATTEPGSPKDSPGPAQASHPEMIELSGGTFEMGCVSGELCDDDERPPRLVTVAPFLIGRFEVTFAEYDRFAVATGRPLPEDEGWGRDSHPVINVTWYDATAYAEWLSQETGEPYRLPTEAEWEYAARAGTQTPFWTGTCIHTDQANYNGRHDDTDCGAKTGVCREQTVSVGSLPANPWGLHEVAGNVWEWTCSEYGRDYYSGAEKCAGKNGADARVLRGGSWVDDPWNVRSASRFWWIADAQTNTIGFRLARSR